MTTLVGLSDVPVSVDGSGGLPQPGEVCRAD